MTAAPAVVTAAPAPAPARGLDLAIVTCVRGYGRYLPEWAASICALRRRPAMVGIMSAEVNGDHAGVAEARALLEQAGLRVVTATMPGERNIGRLRNGAVALSTTEWVMHLDADDMVMPHCLDDVAELAPHADVVALGYERCGDLAAGPRQRVKLYRSTTGPAAVANPTPASGVSPFRRTLWERRPYPTDQVGGWDTTLWRGFGHLGARFVATRRPCFRYRQHADSVFNVRRFGGWKAALTGQQLAGAARGDHGVTVVVPVGEDNAPERTRAWAWLRGHLLATLPREWQILEGRASRAPWCKGNAVSAALTLATGRILVLLDADCVLPAQALTEAVHLVASGGAPWVVPHRLVYRLSAATTAAVLARPAATAVTPAPAAQLARGPYVGFPGGGCVVVPRAAYRAFGGIPRDFVGWGAEDECLALVLDTMLGPHHRLTYPLVHLWHPGIRAADRLQYRRNRQLLGRYQAVRGDRERLWDMISRTNPDVVVDQFAHQRRLRALAAAGTSQPTVEVNMHDLFAQRRLARAQAAKQGRRNMAGALDNTRAYNLRRQQQQAANREAAAAAQQRREQAAAQASLPEAERRRLANAARAAQRTAAVAGHHGAAPPAPPAPAAPAKRQPRASAAAPATAHPPTIRKDPPAPPAVPKRRTLDDVVFASPAAKRLAGELGVTAEAFAKVKAGERGYTAAQVRQVAKAAP